MKLKLLAVTALALPTLVISASPASAVPAHHPKVSIKAGHTKITLGAKTSIAGQVTPNERGHDVRLQRYYSSAWHDAARYKLSASSRYRFTVKPTSAGTWTYRVVDDKKPGWTAAKSTTVHIAVHRKSTPAPTPTPPAASCYPLTNGGNCYEPGEYCRNSDHGASGVAGDGESIVCEDNNGWRWEPA